MNTGNISLPERVQLSVERIHYVWVSPFHTANNPQPFIVKFLRCITGDEILKKAQSTYAPEREIINSMYHSSLITWKKLTKKNTL